MHSIYIAQFLRLRFPKLDTRVKNNMEVKLKSVLRKKQ